MGDPLSHIDERGQARMVDVSLKQATLRRARAESWVEMSLATFLALSKGETPKGDVIAAVRLGAIMACKATSSLIPLCHPLPIDSARCEVVLHPPDRVQIMVEVQTTGRTGVEMEALTGASVGSLILYDMLKALDKELVIGPTQLLEKSGGKSGNYRRTVGEA